MEFSFLIRCHNNAHADVEICDFQRQFSFDSYLHNGLSNFTKMVTFES